MQRTFNFAALLALAAAGNSPAPAQGVGGMADVAIIDRDSGAVLSPHYYRGEYWVAGTPGARYAIEIRNRLGERVLAVTSVDGVNVVSGATAGWDQTGYVFSPGERYQITGWRKSDAEIAAFTFTDSPNSYAERTGRPANVGVIGVALFRERAPQPVYGNPTIGRATGQPSGQPPAPRPDASESARRQGMDRPESAKSAESARAADSAATANSAGAANSAGGANPASAFEERLAAAAPAPSGLSMPRAAAPAPKLGTGHGEREYSYVNHTDFERLQQQPNEVIRIRYDSFDNLLAMGIVKRPRPAVPGVNPFPVSPEQQYVPDPRG
jgi:hypothetical protein